MIFDNPKQSKLELVDNVIEPSTTLKRKCIKTLNFGSVFCPLYCLSRIWGLAPFTIVKSSNGEVQNPKLRLRDVLWFLVMVCGQLYFMQKSWANFNTSSIKIKKETWILIISARGMEIFAFAYGIATIFMNICNRFKVINIIKMFIHFDREVCWFNFSPCSPFSVWSFCTIYGFRYLKMAKINVRFNYSHDCRRTTLLCFAAMTYIVVFPIISKSTYAYFCGYEGISRLLSYWCSEAVYFSTHVVPCLMYTILLHNLHKRYKSLNSVLRYRHLNINFIFEIYLVHSNFDNFA